MSETQTSPHRLEGLEPDNLLAFLALLGLLRALEESRPGWQPRVCWSLEKPPLRPVLMLREAVAQDDICAAAAQGAAMLARGHDFAGKEDLTYTIDEARQVLEAGRVKRDYATDLITALLSDGAVKMAQGKPQDAVEATPFCLLFGQGHQHFLQRLAAVPRQEAPPPRGRGKKAVPVTAEACLAEALFATWARSDPTFSFRWDPAEDVRYALMFGDPSNAANKEGTQHGANRLAAIGLSVLSAVPVQRRREVRLTVPGGVWDRGFSFAWPIWRHPLRLGAIRSLLLHPDLRQPGALERLGVDHVRMVRRISVGKFMNFTAGRAIETEDGVTPR